MSLQDLCARRVVGRGQGKSLFGRGLSPIRRSGVADGVSCRRQREMKKSAEVLLFLGLPGLVTAHPVDEPSGAEAE